MKQRGAFKPESSLHILRPTDDGSGRTSASSANDSLFAAAPPTAPHVNNNKPSFAPRWGWRAMALVCCAPLRLRAKPKFINQTYPYLDQQMRPQNILNPNTTYKAKQGFLVHVKSTKRSEGEGRRKVWDKPTNIHIARTRRTTAALVVRSQQGRGAHQTMASRHEAASSALLLWVLLLMTVLNHGTLFVSGRVLGPSSALGGAAV